MSNKEEQELRDAVWGAMRKDEELSTQNTNWDWLRSLVVGFPLTLRVDVNGYTITFKVVSIGW